MGLSKHFAGEEHDRQDCFASFGVGLEVHHPARCPRGQPNQPQQEASQRSNQQEHLPARRTLGTSMNGCEAEALPLEVAEAFLDLHLQSVQAQCLAQRTPCVRQRSGQQPRRLVALASPLCTVSTTVRLARSATFRRRPREQVERGGIGPPPGQQAIAEDPGRGTGGCVQRRCPAPVLTFVQRATDAVPDASDVMQAERLDVTEPGHS